MYLKHLLQLIFVHSPHGARVSGVVEETPGRLEYEVALYKEAPPVSRHTNHSVDLPVDQVTGVRSVVICTSPGLT